MKTSLRGLAERIAALAWSSIEAHLDGHGYAMLPALLTSEETADLAACYVEDDLFRSTIVMGRHGFGRGEYRYFAYPLPPLVAQLRRCLYARLAPIANRWSEALGLRTRYPAEHAEYLHVCRRGGQMRPTPLLLHYGEGDYNCLHQDLYGDHTFPLQATFLLSRPGHDFAGGEFVLVEQRPRQQSRAQVVALGRGDGVIFPVRYRPVHGARGWRRLNLRHGVSSLTRGARYSAGIIFHDAR